MADVPEATLLETTTDSNGNPWTLVIRPDGSITLIYLFEQIATLDATEGRRLLNQPCEGAERLRTILEQLEIRCGKIDLSVRSRFTKCASWIDEHW